MDEPLDRVTLKTLRDFDVWTRLFMPRFTRVEQRLETLNPVDLTEMRRMLERLSLAVFGEYSKNAGLGQEVSDLKRWRDEEASRALQVLDEAAEDLRGLRRMRTTVRWLVATAVGAALITIVSAGVNWMLRPSAVISQQQAEIDTLKAQQEKREKQLGALLRHLEERAPGSNRRPEEGGVSP